MKSKDQQFLEEAYELVQLNELFNTVYPQNEFGTLERTAYVFSPTGDPKAYPRYTVDFSVKRGRYEDDSDVLTISFDYQGAPGALIVTGLTGSGKASQVMGTVIHVTKKYLGRIIEQVKRAEESGSKVALANLDYDLRKAEITFTAKMHEKGRVKFYDSLADAAVNFLNTETKDLQGGLHWSWKGKDGVHANDSKSYSITANAEGYHSPGHEKTAKPSFNKLLTPSS